MIRSQLFGGPLRPGLLCFRHSRGQTLLNASSGRWGCRPQIAAGWIVAFAICHTLCAQTTFRPPVVFSETATAPVTLQELQHVVPKNARAEMEKAVKAMRKHDWAQAVDRLRKAVAIDAEFVEARNNLGICLFFSDPTSAITQWEEAIKIDPNKGLLFKHLAVGYAAARNLEAAERAARKFLALDGTIEARALLGFVLHEEEKYTAETVGLLERSAADYPTAHVFAARVLLNQGQSRRANEHLHAYLSRGEMERRQEASELLDYIHRMELTQKPAQNR
jgi:tetratricopeptide (TPR) repeat protein